MNPATLFSHAAVSHLMLMALVAMIRLPRLAGGCSAPHVPSRTIAICPSTTARVSRTTKSILGMPMCVLTMLTGTSLYFPVGKDARSMNICCRGTIQHSVWMHGSRGHGVSQGEFLIAFASSVRRMGTHGAAHTWPSHCLRIPSMHACPHR